MDDVDEEELQEILRRLQVGLNEAGLVSIVEQGLAAVLEGHRIEVGESDRRGALGRKLRTGDIRTEPLSTREHISLLLDLTEVAIGGTLSIETRLARFAVERLPGGSPHAPAITFAADPAAPKDASGIEQVDTREPWDLRRPQDIERDRDRLETPGQVLEIIRELRANLDVIRRPELAPSSRPFPYYPNTEPSGDWLE